MQYSNKHLVEVNFGFYFSQETTQWDSTFFGRFYEKIIPHGFLGKEERKGISIIFGLKGNISKMPSQEVEDQVIFKDNKGRAITMAKNKISFHIVSDYTVWDSFLNDFIKPLFAIYKQLGLGNGIRECNLIYLNRFSRSGTDNLSEYFKMVSPINHTLGIEENIVVQRVIDNGSNLLIAKLNAQRENEKFNIHFECGAKNKFNLISNSASMDWIKQANEVHAPVHDFFELLITDKLRAEL